MPEGLVPRMAIEWGFLILLAVGAGWADLRPVLIVLVMAIGWILVVLVELLAWRARPAYAVTETVVEPPADTLHAPAPEPARAAPVLPPPTYDFEFDRAAVPQPAAGVEEPTAVVPAPAAPGAEPPAKKLDPEDPYAPAPEQERLRRADQRVVYS